MISKTTKYEYLHGNLKSKTEECRPQSFAHCFEEYVSEKLSEKGCKNSNCWMWSMPNLPVCENIKDINCVKGKVSGGSLLSG